MIEGTHPNARQQAFKPLQHTATNWSSLGNETTSTQYMYAQLRQFLVMAQPQKKLVIRRIRRLVIHSLVKMKVNYENSLHQSVDPAISIHVRENDDQARKNIRLHPHPHDSEPPVHPGHAELRLTATSQQQQLKGANAPLGQPAH
jgi:hypothetical protein